MASMQNAQSSRAGVPKRKMNQIAHRTPSAKEQEQHAYWSGFSVWLFIVLLAVFTWALHYRLAQYESIQQAGGHVPTAKMWLTDRNQIPVLSNHAMADSMVLFVAFAFASSLFGFGKPEPSLILREQPVQPPGTRIRTCLNHFFFLPPPSLFAAL
jgi:hypothetical protein